MAFKQCVTFRFQNSPDNRCVCGPTPLHHLVRRNLDLTISDRHQRGDGRSINRFGNAAPKNRALTHRARLCGGIEGKVIPLRICDACIVLQRDHLSVQHPESGPIIQARCNDRLLSAIDQHTAKGGFRRRVRQPNGFGHPLRVAIDRLLGWLGRLVGHRQHCLSG